MKRRLIIVAVVLLVLSAIPAFWVYDLLVAKNVKANAEASLYVNSNMSYDNLLDLLDSTGQVGSMSKFEMIAERMKLSQSYKAGRYVISENMSYVDLVRKLRSGKWENQVIKLKAEMKRAEVISYLANELEADSAELIAILQSDWVLEKGFTVENIYCIFLPDHYYFNWASSAQTVMDRFYTEYKKFWNKDRLGKAYKKDLSAEEACILASIVDGEAIHNSEMPTIAGLYLNRLERGQLLQADPTILFLIQEEGRQRVLNRDLKVEHPYNTYLNVGLPPGPIMLADKRAINAVLHAEDHNYIYMCAKEDGSFYHYFTASYAQHLRNRAKYSRSLNSQKIFR